MKGVILELSDSEIARRRRLGLDRWDEMWEGVLHMPPAPFTEHQRIVLKASSFLDPLLQRKRLGSLLPGVNVIDDGSAREDYRIPDFSFVAAGREAAIGEDGIHGGPDGVIEVRSPGDETYEKLPFFLKLRVREVIVIDRDSKRPEIFRLAGDQYLAVSADRDGWLTSEVLRIRLQRVTAPGERPRLAIEDLDDTEWRTEI